MQISRRVFLQSSAAGVAAVSMMRGLRAEEGVAGPKVRISARQFGDNLEAGKKAGMDGLEIGVGGPADTLHVADAAYRATLKERMKAIGLPVSSLSMDLMNGCPVGLEPRSGAWLAQCIEAAGDLKAVAILVPFFGKADLLQGKELKKAEVDAMVACVKEVAPKAKAAGVMLGLENRCSAQQNLDMLDRIGSDAVGVYYDIGNSTNGGYDVPAELRALKGRLASIHFKDDGNFLGEGKVKMEPVAAALKEIGYPGWIVLETACPTHNTEADCKRNAEFIRKLMGQAA